LWRRDAAIGSHDVHAKMAPWDGALGHVVDIVVILVRDLVEAEALDEEIGVIDSGAGADLLADQKTGIVAQFLNVVGGADLFDQNSVQVDVHTGVWMPRHLQVVPYVFINALDLRDPFSAWDAEVNFQIAVSLFDFDGSGGHNVILLILGGGLIDLEAGLHGQALHALQRIPQATTSVDLGLGVFAFSLELEDVTVSGSFFFVGDGDELWIINTGNRA